MVAVLTQRHEQTTSEVIDWLKILKVPVLRINGEDFFRPDFQISYTVGTDNSGGFTFNIAGEQVDTGEIKVVWYRRWSSPFGDLNEKLVQQVNGQASNEIKQHIKQEFYGLTNVFVESLNQARWINFPTDITLSKFNVLQKAQETGIPIPASIIVTSKNELYKFAATYDFDLITKPITEVNSFQQGNEIFSLFTTAVDKQIIDSLADTFAPSLFQQNVRKKYEVRVFYIGDEFYPMAIFSQFDQRTITDFRKYNYEHPNQTVPVILPADLTEKLYNLTTKLNIYSGSIDLIRGIDGEYYFLELNPVGHFGMVSYPCNYYLEKKVAEHIQKLWLSKK